MGRVFQLAKARTEAPKPIALPKSLLAFAEAFGVALPNSFDEFILRRCKQGALVYIRSGSLTVNLSAATKIYPANFKAARVWIKSVADRQRWQMTETRKF